MGAALRNGDVVRWFYAEAATAPCTSTTSRRWRARLVATRARRLEHVSPDGVADPREQVQILGDAKIGRPLGFEELSRESRGNQMIAMSSAAAADMLLDAYRLRWSAGAGDSHRVRCHRCAARSVVRDWATDHASDFATLVVIRSAEAVARLQLREEPEPPRAFSLYLQAMEGSVWPATVTSSSSLGLDYTGRLVAEHLLKLYGANVP